MFMIDQWVQPIGPPPHASCRLSIQKAAETGQRERGMPITVHLLNIRHAFLCMRADVVFGKHG